MTHLKSTGDLAPGDLLIGSMAYMTLCNVHYLIDDECTITLVAPAYVVSYRYCPSSGEWHCVADWEEPK